MPYYISQNQSDCDGWAAVKQESDGSYTTIGCHTTKQDAIDQMIAVSIAEDMEPGGEVSSRSEDLKKIERRTFQVQDVEARQSDDGVMRLSGYAAVFNDASVPLPFKERIAPGAFRKTLSEQPDVRLLVNHEGLPLARTKNGTLKLTEDDRGLRFDADLADTQEARDIYTLVQRGDVDQMSFAFRVIRQKWNDNKSERTLTEVSLADGDVSVVTYPAYPTTTVEAREKISEALMALKEGRALDGESMLVVQAILDKISESYDNLEEGKNMLEVLVGLKTLEPMVEVEQPEVELEPVDVSRKISLRLAKAIIQNTK
jgi:HK97 family phage prohead protease